MIHLINNKFTNRYKQLPWETIFEVIFVLLIFIWGLIYRLDGISTNHSFWSDESYISSIARNMVLGKYNLLEGITKVPYERLQILITYFSFHFFGLTEWAARFPVIFFGSVSIVISYLLAKKLSNIEGGMLASVLVSITQISLSQSTQAKPYVILFCLMILSQYLLLVLPEYKSKTRNRLTFFIILVNFTATLFNFLGIIIWIPFFVYLFIDNKKFMQKWFVPLSMVTIFIFYIFKVHIVLFSLSLKFNWWMYLNELLFRQYLVFTLPSLVVLLLIKHRPFVISWLLEFGTLVLLWTFFKESHNIRYLYPLIGYLFVLFGIFWGQVSMKFHTVPLVIFLVVFLTLFISGYKIVRKPMAYYSPNSDLWADVQNADYKTFYQKWELIYPDFEKYLVIADVFDDMSWYTNRYPNYTFSKLIEEIELEPQFGITKYRRLKDFKQIVAMNKKGFVIIHDWESFMPDDIKEYVKKNLKFEFRVESMDVSPNDKWPLELYSWGFEATSSSYQKK